LRLLPMRASSCLLSISVFLSSFSDLIILSRTHFARYPSSALFSASPDSPFPKASALCTEFTGRIPKQPGVPFQHIEPFR
ncbi:MAG: hypothetical protein ACLTAC_16430, partial [Hungatella sp.]